MISIIIPTYNEGSVLEKTLLRLSEISCKEGKEIIIADGGSEDSTVEIAKKYARVVKSGKGKAKQLNEGAKHAKGDILFFVHADMFVPDGALTAMCNQLEEGFDGGGFANEFDEHNEKIKQLGTILNFRFFRVGEQSDRCIFYGDNGIFVKKGVFEKLGGFKEIPIMEDYDFSLRMKKYFKVRQIKYPKLIVSSRRHVDAGFFKTRIQWILIKKLYLLGISPHALARWYADVR
ncbi:MAG: TIGR04283 family arsenosugar biosynthesis glycosyltransferase [Bacteroidetes bacterium]|nr:TIGR04283 family arsenosugar biosynthesis glycosyltransferase [Bacteroidota bacterium]